MNLTLRIPDDMATFALADYQAGRRTGFDLDGLLKPRGINDAMTLTEWEREQQTLDRRGL